MNARWVKLVVAGLVIGVSAGGFFAEAKAESQAWLRYDNLSEDVLNDLMQVHFAVPLERVVPSAYTVLLVGGDFESQPVLMVSRIKQSNGGYEFGPGTLATVAYYSVDDMTSIDFGAAIENGNEIQLILDGILRPLEVRWYAPESDTRGVWFNKALAKTLNWADPTVSPMFLPCGIENTLY